jgi:hypothetical protein
MPVEISVGPPLLSINHGTTFMVTDLGGEIQADTEQGILADDTRFVSYYAISANGDRAHQPRPQDGRRTRPSSSGSNRRAAGARGPR